MQQRLNSWSRSTTKTKATIKQLANRIILYESPGHYKWIVVWRVYLTSATPLTIPYLKMSFRSRMLRTAVQRKWSWCLQRCWGILDRIPSAERNGTSQILKKTITNYLKRKLVLLSDNVSLTWGIFGTSRKKQLLFLSQPTKNWFFYKGLICVGFSRSNIGYYNLHPKVRHIKCKAFNK